MSESNILYERVKQLEESTRMMAASLEHIELMIEELVASHSERRDNGQQQENCEETPNY